MIRVCTWGYMRAGLKEGGSVGVAVEEGEVTRKGSVALAVGESDDTIS